MLMLVVVEFESADRQTCKIGRIYDSWSRVLDRPFLDWCIVFRYCDIDCRKRTCVLELVRLLLESVWT